MHMMQPLVIRLSQEDRKALELLAREEDTSIAEVARKSIKATIKKSKKADSFLDFLDLWDEENKKVKSLYHDTDLSTNYKQYLYGPKSPKFGYLWKNKNKKK